MPPCIDSLNFEAVPIHFNMHKTEESYHLSSPGFSPVIFRQFMLVHWCCFFSIWFMTFCSVPSNWFLTFILSYITSSSNSLAKGYDPPPLVIIGWRRWYYMYIRAIKLFHDIVIFGMRFISAYTMKVTINIIISLLTNASSFLFNLQFSYIAFVW